MFFGFITFYSMFLGLSIYILDFLEFLFAISKFYDIIMFEKR